MWIHSLSFTIWCIQIVNIFLTYLCVLPHFYVTWDGAQSLASFLVYLGSSGTTVFELMCKMTHTVPTYLLGSVLIIILLI